MIEGNFEARKIGMRQNKEGVIISFVVQPDDFEAALAMVPIGARVMIGWAQIGDDEKPIESNEIRSVAHPPLSTVPRPQANEAGISKPKKRFKDYPLSAQSAMLCDEPDFWKFLSTVYPARWGQSSAEHTAKRAADTVRTLCSVTSRREFDTPGPRADLWGMVYENFQQWQTDQKYAGARR